MLGADDIYVRARRALLDALDALADHRNAIVLVGAQAIYLHVGEGDLAVAPYTTDGDIALNPASLADDPKLDALMKAAGFAPAPEPDRLGTWLAPDNIPVDLLVPDAVGGPGRRAARLPAHGNRVARKGRGLEASLVDNSPMVIASLDPGDSRQITVAVAGPAALLVAKLHKLYDRKGNPGRLDDKDALDVYRILRGVSTEELADALHSLLGDQLSRGVTQEALSHLDELFGSSGALGSQMAGRNSEPLEDAESIALSCAILTEELLMAIRTLTQ